MAARKQQEGGGVQRLKEKLATREQLEEGDRHRNGQKEKNRNKKKVKVRGKVRTLEKIGRDGRKAVATVKK